MIGYHHRMKLLVGALLACLFGGLAIWAWRSLGDGFLRWFLVGVGAQPVLLVLTGPGERFAGRGGVADVLTVLLLYLVPLGCIVAAFALPGARVARGFGLLAGLVVGMIVGMIAVVATGYESMSGFRLG